METLTNAMRRVKARGTRYAVIGSIRPGEAICSYADTVEQAERIRADFAENWGYYQVQVYPPQYEDDDELQELSRLRRERDKVKAALDDVTGQVRALVVRLVQKSALSESAAADRAGVDRMTVRKWLGKR